MDGCAAWAPQRPGPLSAVEAATSGLDCLLPLATHYTQETMTWNENDFQPSQADYRRVGISLPRVILRTVHPF